VSVITTPFDVLFDSPVWGFQSLYANSGEKNFVRPKYGHAKKVNRWCPVCFPILGTKTHLIPSNCVIHSIWNLGCFIWLKMVVLYYKRSWWFLSLCLYTL